MKEKTKYWIKFSDSDFDAAYELIKSGDFNNIVLFLCEQAVEKLLKAIYEELDLKIPRIHNIVKLYSLLPQEIQNAINLNIDELTILDTVYIDSRYPSEIGILPTGFPSNEKTKHIFEFSKKIISSIKVHLTKK
ncbi:MAG: HEPN domain-containing protein [Ignavibacteriae bacterium]|nr:HEPN domain-containing protein [Ignavibacteriota bacterium]